ncbi:hypothetical protein HHK36_007942 [Tetracentron sinense]|uniref:Vacuolar iron transporter n=1 Tax=Tetracentron sinense TaxID=13715 RepID=A0A834ZDS6_TETSI|nr:hypothetical protein HHK36_007942 [Tetracentron sinense]
MAVLEAREMAIPGKDIEKQKTHEHEEKNFDYSQRAQWLRAAVLGANDGLISTASLMMGVGAAAIASALAFSVGAIVPLLAAAFIREHKVRLCVVASVASVALLVFGVMGAVLGGAPVPRSCARVLVGGWMAMVRLMQSHCIRALCLVISFAERKMFLGQRLQLIVDMKQKQNGMIVYPIAAVKRSHVPTGAVSEFRDVSLRIASKYEFLVPSLLLILKKALVLFHTSLGSLK